MATTTSFGWEIPDDSDLVKDGALAMRTLGNAIDASMTDLKGGTTGQILSKTSNTDMDFTWITNDQGDITEVQAGTGISVASGTGPIPVVTNTVATAYDAKADLIVGTGADTFSRLAVGANNTVLTADSSVSPTGLKWAAPSSGGMTLLASGSLAGVGTVTSATISLTGYLQLYVQLIKPLPATDGATHRVRFNGDSGANYDWGLTDQITQAFTETSFRLVGEADNATDVNFASFTMGNPVNAGYKIIEIASIVANQTTPANFRINTAPAVYNAAAAITSVTIFLSSGNWTSGDYYVYGVK